MIRALPITNKKMEKIEQLDKFQFVVAFGFAFPPQAGTACLDSTARATFPPPCWAIPCDAM